MWFKKFCDTSREDITTGCILYNKGYLSPWWPCYLDFFTPLEAATLSALHVNLWPLSFFPTLYLKSDITVYISVSVLWLDRKPLVVTCTTAGSRPRATLQWTIGLKDVTSDATERSSHNTDTDMYTVMSDLRYSVNKVTRVTGTPCCTEYNQ
jgi:hypothetical protein